MISLTHLCQEAILSVAFPAEKRRKRGRSESIKVTVTIIQSALQ